MTPTAACTFETCFLSRGSTGKERDTESGNDYFGARYYASSMGRFMANQSQTIDANGTTIPGPDAFDWHSNQ
jgi:RHS repeat-associated protein